MMGNILNRKLSELKGSYLLQGESRESTRQFRMRPVGQVTNSDQSAQSNVPQAGLPVTGFVRNSAPNLE